MVLEIHKSKINLSSSGKTATIAASTAVTSLDSCVGFLIWSIMASVLLLYFFLSALSFKGWFSQLSSCHLQLLQAHQLTSCGFTCMVQPPTNWYSTITLSLPCGVISIKHKLWCSCDCKRQAHHYPRLPSSAMITALVKFPFFSSCHAEAYRWRLPPPVATGSFSQPLCRAGLLKLL